MRNFKFVAAALAASISMAGCGTASIKDGRDAAIKSGQLDIANAPNLVPLGNEAGLIYFSPDNSVVLRHADATEQILSQGNEQEFKNGYAASFGNGNSRYVVWRAKLIKGAQGIGAPGDKVVYVRALQDGGKTLGPVHRLNLEGGAFKPMITGNGDGDAYVIWTDERNSGSAHDVYLNLTHDGGATWKKQDIRLTGKESTMSANPSIVADGNNVYVSWLTYTPDTKQFKVFVRTSTNRGEAWGAPMAALVSSTQPATPVMGRAGNRLLLCWADAEAAHCKNSSDQGKTWSAEVAIAESSHTGGLFLETDPMNKPHLLMIKKGADEKDRNNLFHVFSEDGLKFSSPHRLTGGSAYRSSSLLPSVGFGDQGAMLIAWMDMRYLRPGIEVAYSPDGGKSWPDQNVILAGANKVFNFFPTVTGLPNKNFKLAWVETPSRTAPVTNIVLTEFKPGTKGVTMPVPDVNRLKARVDQFWKLREQAKWAELYDFMDPFYREANSRESYVKSQGSVKYYEHSRTGEPSVSTVKASVPVKYVSEVPEFLLQGKKVAVPKTEAEISQEWVWVDGEWYVVFMDIMGGTFLLD